MGVGLVCTVVFNKMWDDYTLKKIEKKKINKKQKKKTPKRADKKGVVRVARTVMEVAYA